MLGTSARREARGGCVPQLDQFAAMVSGITVKPLEVFFAPFRL